MTIAYPAGLCEAVFPPSQVLAIGDFDGIHLGHQEVIRRAVDRAGQTDIVAAVMTFDPHPRSVLGRSQYEALLTPLAERLEFFEKLGVDYTYVVQFDRVFSERSAEEFVSGMLFAMHTESVVVGFDFRFGHQGAGTADTLCEMGKGQFAVEVVRPYHLNGNKVSSTFIRDYLSGGEPKKAAELLGRPYSVTGIVVEGDKRGRTIGFPTANIRMQASYVCPRRGVYAVRAAVDDRLYNGVMNIGFKPTFIDGGIQTLEAHLFDFSGDLYGKTITVYFMDYIREEIKFTSVDELVRQIQSDAESAHKSLELVP